METHVVSSRRWWPWTQELYVYCSPASAYQATEALQTLETSEEESQSLVCESLRASCTYLTYEPLCDTHSLGLRPLTLESTGMLSCALATNPLSQNFLTLLAMKALVGAIQVT